MTSWCFSVRRGRCLLGVRLWILSYRNANRIMWNRLKRIQVMIYTTLKSFWFTERSSNGRRACMRVWTLFIEQCVQCILYTAYHTVLAQRFYERQKTTARVSRISRLIKNKRREKKNMPKNVFFSFKSISGCEQRPDFIVGEKSIWRSSRLDTNHTRYWILRTALPKSIKLNSFHFMHWARHEWRPSVKLTCIARCCNVCVEPWPNYRLAMTESWWSRLILGRSIKVKPEFFGDSNLAVCVFLMHPMISANITMMGALKAILSVWYLDAWPSISRPALWPLVIERQKATGRSIKYALNQASTRCNGSCLFVCFYSRSIAVLLCVGCEWRVEYLAALSFVHFFCLNSFKMMFWW